MVNGSTGTLTMRLVRSKLRKREEPRTASPTNIVVKEQKVRDDHETSDHFWDTETETTNNCTTIIKDHQHVTFMRTNGITAQAVGHSDVAEWTFPPKAPAPHIYHINTEMLVDNERISFKGFRKQFSGRFKRLVARKPEPAPVIPPELKPQLKTIYVY